MTEIAGWVSPKYANYVNLQSTNAKRASQIASHYQFSIK